MLETKFWNIFTFKLSLGEFLHEANWTRAKYSVLMF
jgi:hypothetical protein